MSEVKADDLTEINTAEDVFALYEGSGQNAKGGLEVELSYFNPESENLDVMSLEQNEEVRQNALKALVDGDWVHNEPTSEVLEVASNADSYANIKKVLDDTNAKMRVMCKEGEKLGLKRSYFQELPERTYEDLLSRIVDVERYNVMYVPYREDMRSCVQYFAVCKSNQVSVSYYDMDHMLLNVRRLYTLAPFLFLLTDNSTGFTEGKPFSGHAGMYLRHYGLLEGRGNVIPYVFKAKSGEEYVARHIEHVMNNPLFMYYNRDGSLTGVPSGDWSVTFNSLKERGLNIASNYYLAQSVLWPDVKIAALKDSSGSVFGHRYEARMFGVGLHQHQTGFIITMALAFHPDFGQKVDALLERYGFDASDLPAMYDLVLKSYAAAREHDGAFFDVAYGTGTLAEFAKDFADLIEPVAQEMGVTDEAQPMLTIMRTGCTDGKVNRILFPTLDEVLAFQREYDCSIFDNFNQSAHSLFERELSAAGGCKAAAG